MFGLGEKIRRRFRRVRRSLKRKCNRPELMIHNGHQLSDAKDCQDVIVSRVESIFEARDADHGINTTVMNENYQLSSTISVRCLSLCLLVKQLRL